MGKMTQQWKIGEVKQQLNAFVQGESLSLNESYNEQEMIDKIYSICLDLASNAKSEHNYINRKGELESSIGVVVIKDRGIVERWKLQSSSGTDPARGTEDIRRIIDEQILGKSELPDGTNIPNKGIVGIVFAAAPYSGYVEKKHDSGRRSVLLDFAPSSDYVFNIIKSVVK
jgi:hypothetical protein